MIEGAKLARGYKHADFNKGGKVYEALEDKHGYYYLVPFTPGCSLVFSDLEEPKSKARFHLNRESMKNGFIAMQQKYPRHWADFVTENDDAETADVWLQLCLFGDIIYG